MSLQTETDACIALLAPVPLIHLQSAPSDKVAFGSNKVELFKQLDDERNDMPVDVYIYVSHPGGYFDQDISWFARYLKFERSDSLKGTYRGDPRFRPDSTFDDTAFLGFWLVEALKRYDGTLKIADLIGFGKKKPYGSKFVPHGPLLIKHP